MFADRSPTPPRQRNAIETLVVMDDGSELLCWDTGGAGPPIVLAHPHTGNLRSWQFQQPALVDAGYRVLAYSRRSYFGSTPCLAASPGTQAGDLAQIVNHFGVEQAHVIGSAAGGSTALDFALSYPDRTLSATIASSLMSIDAPELEVPMSHLGAEWFRALPDAVKELGSNYRALCPSGVERWEAIRRLNPPRGPDSQWQPLQSVVNWDTLAANEVPMLLLVGGGDLYMPPAVLEAIAQRTGHSSYRMIELCGHAPQIEDAETFNAIVLDFLAQPHSIAR